MQVPYSTMHRGLMCTCIYGSTCSLLLIAATLNPLSFLRVDGSDSQVHKTSFLSFFHISLDDHINL